MRIKAVGILLSVAGVLFGDTWKTQSDGLYTVPANWTLGTVPGANTEARFNVNGGNTYTVGFPDGEFLDASSTFVAPDTSSSGGTREFAFDLQGGKSWYKYGSTNWPNGFFKIQDAFGNHVFNTESLPNPGGVGLIPQMYWSNALFRSQCSRTGGWNTNVFDGGFFNFYDPKGVRTTNSLVMANSGNGTNILIFRNGSKMRSNMFSYRGYGKLNEMIVSNAEIEAFGGFQFRNNHDARKVEVSEAVLQFYSGTINVTNGDLYVATIGLTNTGSRGTINIYPGAVFNNNQYKSYLGNGGTAVLNLLGGEFNHRGTGNGNDVRLACVPGATGIVNLVSGFVRSPSIDFFVGYTGNGLLNVSGGEFSALRLSIGNNLSATGIVTVTGGSVTAAAGTSIMEGGYSRLEVLDGCLTYADTLGLAGQVGRKAEIFLRGGTNCIKILRLGPSGSVRGGTSYLEIAGGLNDFNTVYCGYAVNDSALTRIIGGTNGVSATLDAGLNAGGLGTIEIAGGVVRIGQYIRTGVNGSLTNGTSTIRIVGGTVSVTNGSVNICDNSGNVSTGRLELAGGTLSAIAIRGWNGSKNKGGSGFSVLSADGGLITPAWRTDSQFLGTFDLAELGATGLAVDTLGQTAGLHQVFTDKAGASGRFTKAGLGTINATLSSAHAETVVAGGTLALSTGISFGRGITVTNSALLSLAAGHTGLSLESLTLGNAVSPGYLTLDNSAMIQIAAAGGFSAVNAGLRLSAPTAVGNYTLFRCAGNVPASACANIGVVNGTAELYYSFAPVYSESTDKTDLVLTISSTPPPLALNTWTGVLGGLWDEAGNWSESAVPNAQNRTVFGPSQNYAVEVGAGADSGLLEIASSTPYAFSGAGVLTVGGGGVFVSAGAHTVTSPFAVNAPVNLDAGTVLTVSGDIPSGRIQKVGKGRLVLQGENTFSGGIYAGGGILEVAVPSGFGSMAGVAGNILLQGDTLRYSGTETTVPAGFTIASGATNKAVVFETRGNLALTGAFDAASGVLIKRGAADLTLVSSDGLVNTLGYLDGWGTTPNNGLNTSALLFEENGSSPSNTCGYAGLTIAEGVMRFRGNSQNTLFNIVAPVMVGARVSQGTANPVLEVDGCRVNTGSGNRHTHVGAGSLINTPMDHPQVRVINGGLFTANHLRFGRNSDGAAAIYPGLYVGGATVQPGYFTLGEHTAGSTQVLLENNSLITGAQDCNTIGPFQMTVDSGSVADFTGSSAVGLRAEQNSKGQLLLKNGGIFRGKTFAVSNVWSTAEVRVTFDGGVFEAFKKDAYCRQAWYRTANHVFETIGAGCVFSIPSGLVYELAVPMTGVGGFAKRGPGELVFGPAVDLDPTTHAQTLTGLVAGGYTGATVVEAGTLSVSDGTINPTAAVAVQSGAGLNLSGTSVPLGSVSGDGIVSNGTVTAVYRFETGKLLTLANIASAQFTVDFGRTDNNPMPKAKIAVATLAGSARPAVGGWKTTGAGAGYSAIYTLEGDTVYADIRYMGGTRIILR